MLLAACSKRFTLRVPDQRPQNCSTKHKPSHATPARLASARRDRKPVFLGSFKRSSSVASPLQLERLILLQIQDGCCPTEYLLFWTCEPSVRHPFGAADCTGSKHNKSAPCCRSTISGFKLTVVPHHRPLVMAQHRTTRRSRCR